MTAAFYRPEYQPFADALRKLLIQQGNITASRLMIDMFGRSPTNPRQPRRQLSLYGVLEGRAYPGEELRKALKLKYNFDFPDIPRVSMTYEKALAKTPARAAVLAHQVALARAPTPPPEPAPVTRPRTPPLFALTIDQDGRSNLTLNLLDITSDEALRAVSVLTVARLIKSTKEE